MDFDDLLLRTNELLNRFPDPKTSVLNGHNQVHACKNVYVTDGSFMASAACVNPSLTYMAFTARAANHAVSELKNGNI